MKEGFIRSDMDSLPLGMLMRRGARRRLRGWSGVWGCYHKCSFLRTGFATARQHSCSAKHSTTTSDTCLESGRNRLGMALWPVDLLVASVVMCDDSANVARWVVSARRPRLLTIDTHQ